MKTDFQLYLWLLGHARPHWKAGLAALIALICSAALEPVMPALMQPLIDQSLIQRDPDSLWQIPALIALTFLGKGIADYLGAVAGQTLAQKTIEDLRLKVFEHQLALPVADHQSEEPGRMMSRIMFDTGLIADAVSTVWLVLIRDSLVLLGLIGFLLYTSWPLTLMVLGVAPLVAWMIRITSRRLRTSSQRLQKSAGRLTAAIEESFLGLVEIKVFRAQRDATERFESPSAELRREQLRIVRVQALNVPMVQVIAASSVALVIYVASRDRKSVV